MESGERKSIETACYRGATMPASVERLWDARRSGNEHPFDLTLLTSLDVLQDGYGEALLTESEDTAANVRAHWQTFEELAFFAEDDNGQLWAFPLWAFPVAVGSGDDPPIVVLDSEGTYTWQGMSLAEALYNHLGDIDDGPDEDALQELAEAGLAFSKQGELGSTTGHLPSFRDRQERRYHEQRGAPKPRLAAPQRAVDPKDAFSWFLKPGDEVLGALRTLLSLDDDAYPDEHWLGCDGEGRVQNVWLREASGLRVCDVPFGCSLAELERILGKPDQAFEGKRFRYNREGAYLLFELNDSRVRPTFIGLDTR